jgi:hypothetical protein
MEQSQIMAIIAEAKIPAENLGLAYEILATHKNPSGIKDLRSYVATVSRAENAVVGKAPVFSMDDETWFESQDFVEFAEKKSRDQILDKVGSVEQESVFDSLNDAGSAADFGRKLGLTPRRGQQLIKKAVQKAEQALEYSHGGFGQGDLFVAEAEEVDA